MWESCRYSRVIINYVESDEDQRQVILILTMGGGTSSSKYQVISMTTTLDVSESWLARCDTDFGSLKSDAFRPSTALGKGKFGLVFLAEHVKTKKSVAIKFISLQTIFIGKHLDHIAHEMHVLESANMSHPFTTHYFGSYKTSGYIALIFEYVMGGELYMRMKKLHKSSLEMAKFYCCEIAAAIHYLHDTLGIVYR